MSKMIINWPTELVSDIARRRSVLYLGAGVSANARNDRGEAPLTWEKFLRRLLDEIPTSEHEYIEKLLEQENYLLACEIIKEKLESHRFSDIAEDCFRRQSFHTAEIHEVIYNLDSRLVITPNVDKIYEKYAVKQSEGTVVIKNYTDKDISKFIRSEDRIIIKAHGTIDSPGEMVFSQSQYNRAKYKYANFYKLLDALALTHTFIFIGCGLNDPDVKLMLENYNYNYSDNRPHYFIAPENMINVDLATSLKKIYNLKILTYTNIKKDHSALLKSLKELLQLVEERRNLISSTQNW